MLILHYLVFLGSIFLCIKSEDNGSMTIYVKLGHNCTTNSSYTFTDGQNVNLVTTPEMSISYAWWKLISPIGSRNLFSELKPSPTSGPNKRYDFFLYTYLVDQSMEGIWEFTYYYLYNFDDAKHPSSIPYKDNTYFQSVCRTHVKIAPKSTTAVPQSQSNNKMLIIACVFGVILLGIIICQAAYIFLLKAKARELVTLKTHNNLSRKSDSAPNDTARYCTNPGQKMMKVAVPEDDDNRDSVIYEAPNIEISGNARVPIQPPQLPAIMTMPRTPRPDHNMKIDPQAMLASAMHSRSPMSDNFPHNLQRPNLERESSIACRPPLPLPPQGHPHNNNYQELYEEMETEDNTYEPPPVINTMPPRHFMPPKKVLTGNLLDVKENTPKMRQGNTPFTPKPQPLRPRPPPALKSKPRGLPVHQPVKEDIMTANEFEQALRRRNNDTMPKPSPGHMPPMQREQARRRPKGDAQPSELEEALRRRNNGPPHALRTKPKGPPVHQPVEEEIYYNENQASSDEEWTYEPLKPLNSYDTNIYNV